LVPLTFVDAGVVTALSFRDSSNLKLSVGLPIAGLAKGPGVAAQMGVSDTGFWDRLRTGFAELRKDSDGRLTAIWESQPEPGVWRLSYYNLNYAHGEHSERRPRSVDLTQS
jgi:hypothetical protein